MQSGTDWVVLSVRYWFCELEQEQRRANRYIHRPGHIQEAVKQHHKVVSWTSQQACSEVKAAAHTGLCPQELAQLAPRAAAA